MPEIEDYDIIIIGTGAGGGTLLRELAPTGLRILVLERGGFLPREKQNQDTREVFTGGRYKAKETWLTRDGREFHPGIHYWVGGNTKVYGAALLRFREADFRELAHAGGNSPAWPITYADLEPHYGRAERLYEVHGQRGLDPTEPPTSSPYPHPPVSNEARVEELMQDLARGGLKPFPLPLGIRLDERRPASSLCRRCRTCDGFPCPEDAKADADTACVRPAMGHPNVRLLTDARVTRLLTDASGGRVTAVDATVEGRFHRFTSDLVVVACGAVNSAALLLRSANDAHPQGLANSSGVVGRHYMCHNNTALIAVTPRRNPTVFEKTFGINDWYFGADDCGHPLGHVQMLGKSDGEMLAADAPGLAPRFALDWMARHALDFWLTSEDLPDPDNRVTIEADGRIRLSYTENNLAAHRLLLKKLRKALDRAFGRRFLPRALYLSKKIPIEGTAHQCGTVRFGTDRRLSALDPFCRAHDVENLYVVDGSFFPSSSAMNPALTIMANAIRVADHLKERLGVERSSRLAAPAGESR